MSNSEIIGNYVLIINLKAGRIMIPESVKEKYILFLDESGNHDLSVVDQNYPVFSLAGCIFPTESYLGESVPAIHTYKNNLFGDTCVILHSRDIRKCTGDFAKLTDRNIRETFYEETEKLIKGLRFRIICSVIRKADLKLWYTIPESPYNLTLCFILERFRHFLMRKGANGLVIAESRDHKQNNDLNRVFSCLMEGDPEGQLGFPTYIRDLPKYIRGLRFYEKNKNISGLQIADMCAYPFGRKIIDPYKENPSFNIIATKLYDGYESNPYKYGFKIFPIKNGLK